MSRTRRSALTFGSGLVMTGATAVASFVTAPLLLRWLGDERFGAFRSASDWLGYIGLLELGVGGALQALLAKALGSGDRADVVGAVRTGVRAYLRVAGLMAIATVALGVALPWLIRLPEDLTAELWAGCAVFLVGFAWLPLAPFRPLADAGQRGYLVNGLLTAQALTAAVAAVGLAYAGWGLTGQFAAVVLGGAVLYVGLAWYGLRRYPELVTGSAAPAVGRALWALSWPTMVFNLSSRLGLLTDNIVIAGLLGPAAVAPFYLTQRVIAVATAQAQAIGSASWAGLIDLYYRGEHDVFARRFAQLTRLTSVVGVTLLLPTAVWNAELIRLWVGPDRYAGPGVTWLAAGNGWALSILSVIGWPLTAAGFVRPVVPVIVTSTAVNVVVSLAATAVLGPVGPLVGTATAFGLVSWWWTLLLLRRHFGTSPGVLVRAALRPAAVAVPYGAGLILLAEFVPSHPPDWPRWAAVLAVGGWLAASAAGYLFLAWLFAFPTDDRAEWAGRFRGWFRRTTGSA